jgi:hypothetical protein
MKKLFFSIIILLAIIACSNKNSVESSEVESAVIKEIIIRSPALTPEELSIENQPYFEIVFEKELRCGNFKTKTAFVPTHRMDGINLLFMVIGNPHHKYELLNFEIEKKSGKFYLGRTRFYMKLLG